GSRGSRRYSSSRRATSTKASWTTSEASSRPFSRQSRRSSTIRRSRARWRVKMSFSARGSPARARPTRSAVSAELLSMRAPIPDPCAPARSRDRSAGGYCALLGAEEEVRPAGEWSPAGLCAVETSTTNSAELHGDRLDLGVVVEHGLAVLAPLARHLE